MSQKDAKEREEHIRGASPLTTPPARLREPSADDQEIDISDPAYDLSLDDSERQREDAETLKD